MKDILVAGGGIGGLAAALALARAGFRATVLEKARELGEIGAGIQLGPNAFHAFDALGVGPQARAMAVQVDALRLMDAVTARDIATIALDAEFRERFGAPYAVVHRGELHGVLLRACREHPLVTLRTAAGVTGYAQDGAAVQARLSDGTAAEGALLVGADGLHSRVRAQMLADGAPRVSGHTTYRSVIPVEMMPEALRWNAATLWAGPKCHIVHYPLSGWKLFNLVVTAHDHASEPVAGEPVERQRVLDAFAHVHPVAQGIIAAGPEWKRWVLCDREPAERWQDGRVALLGDAAHPTLQYLAQGACMALEDAVVLARELAATPDAPEGALARYQAARLLRTARVTLQSRAVGDHVYHPAGTHAALRDAVMGAKTQGQWREAMAWLYDSPLR
ncbi:3-hydroxybenzoate 6-monooxygenase [Roseococcus sp. DSY-14]|uniref:3-hydroxybenzoate 6-monooxygenase n=1 Tax=Roseococcus sp. DSY-14 TaxID=3369650 RepID=UPI00387B50EF